MRNPLSLVVTLLVNSYTKQTGLRSSRAKRQRVAVEKGGWRERGGSVGGSGWREMEKGRELDKLAAPEITLYGVSKGVGRNNSVGCVKGVGRTRVRTPSFWAASTPVYKNRTDSVPLLLTKQKDLGSIRVGSPFSSPQKFGSWTLSCDFTHTINS